MGDSLAHVLPVLEEIFRGSKTELFLCFFGEGLQFWLRFAYFFCICESTSFSCMEREEGLPRHFFQKGLS